MLNATAAGDGGDFNGNDTTLSVSKAAAGESSRAKAGDGSGDSNRTDTTTLSASKGAAAESSRRKASASTSMHHDHTWSLSRRYLGDSAFWAKAVAATTAAQIAIVDSVFFAQHGLDFARDEESSCPQLVLSNAFLGAISSTYGNDMKLSSISIFSKTRSQDLQSPYEVVQKLQRLRLCLCVTKISVARIVYFGWRIQKGKDVHFILCLGDPKIC